MSKPTPSQPTDDETLNPKVATSTLDFLLIELVPLVQRVTDQLQAREQALLEEYRKSKIFNNKPSNRSSINGSIDGEASPTKKDGGGGEEEEEGDMTILGFPAVTPNTQEPLQHRLDAIGYRVGQGLVERFSTHTPRPQSELDGIKFLCKDVWTALYRKPIDNLKTNHRGVFVLTDQRFQPLGRMSLDRRAGAGGLEESLGRAGLYLYFPAGVVRGALSGLGIEATVVAESTEIPTATFQIKTKGAKV